MSYCRRRTWRPRPRTTPATGSVPAAAGTPPTWASGRRYQAARCSPGEPATGPPAAGGATAGTNAFNAALRRPATRAFRSRRSRVSSHTTAGKNPASAASIPASAPALTPTANPCTTAATTLSPASATARESIPTGPQWRTTPPRSTQTQPTQPARNQAMNSESPFPG